MFKIFSIGGTALFGSILAFAQGPAADEHQWQFRKYRGRLYRGL